LFRNPVSQAALQELVGSIVPAEGFFYFILFYLF